MFRNMSSTTKVLEVVQGDPDYENLQEDSRGEVSESLQREDARDQTVQKIEKIIQEQFSFEIDLKGKEVSTINRRVHECRSSLDRLRACILAGYYGYGVPTASVRGVRTGKTRTSKNCLKEASLSDIMKWKRSLPSNLKEQLPEENLTSQNKSSESPARTISSQSTSFSPGRVDPSNLFRPDQKPDSSNLMNGNESRFYVKRRIIIGNTSKFILPEQREGNDRSTHKWMVYVRGPKDDGELQNFISKVWFLLHPSYQPNDLVEVCKPPFQVTRRGWGEFPVRVQLHFVENKNKRVDIIHHLKLDKTYTGLQTLGAETHVDIELDRKHFVGPKSGRPLPQEQNSPSQRETNAPVNANIFNLASKFGQNGIAVDCTSLKGVKKDKYRFGTENGILSDHSYSSIPARDKPSCQDDMKYPTPPTSVPGSSCSTPREKEKSTDFFSIKEDIEQETDLLLKEGVAHFPIVEPEYSLKSGYCANSLEQFFGWHIGKRLAAEWQRALALKAYANKGKDGLGLSTKGVMNYCRLHGHTPMMKVALEEKTLCKFCGEENDSDEEECDEDDDDDDGDDDDDDDDDDNHNGEVKDHFAHEDCVLEFEEDDDFPGTYTTADEFLELIGRPEYVSVKQDEMEEDMNIDVVIVPHQPSSKDFSISRLFFLPVTAEHEWIQEIASDVDVTLTNCDINGVHAPVTSAMLYKACRMFIEDIVRKANRFTWKSTVAIPKTKCILPLHVKKALEVIPHCDFLTSKYLKVEMVTDQD